MLIYYLLIQKNILTFATCEFAHPQFLKTHTKGLSASLFVFTPLLAVLGHYLPRAVCSIYAHLYRTLLTSLASSSGAKYSY